MAGTKTDAAVRYPKDHDQTQIHDPTQDNQVPVQRTQEQAQKASSGNNTDLASSSVEQQLDATMDKDGKPVPDPVHSQQDLVGASQGA
jgi:hypothetical protein